MTASRSGARDSGSADPGSGARASGGHESGGHEFGGRESAELAGLLRRARFEVIPLDGVEDEVLAHLPTDVKVTVTASPRKGLDATLELAERLTRAGYVAVPHISARLIRDRAHLAEVLDRVQAGGVRELFVLAGDPPEPAGEFTGAAELLEAIGPRRAEFDAIGITGYPESHHLISDAETIRAMFAKAPMATHIVSQICFDAATIAGWIAEVRRRGTDLPIWIGVPGPVPHRKLLKVSMKIGLGESARFLRRHRGWMPRLFTRQFKPDRLVRDLIPCATDPAARVGGFHLYTFNEVAGTERWRLRLLERLDQQGRDVGHA
jgi:methylenetetrahydrofolate reductase (NADH)